jgi:hypothetical protein
MYRNWFQLTVNAALLAVETQRVIALRVVKLSRGDLPPRPRQCAMTLVRGGSAGTVIRRYRSHVRSNKRRSSKRTR